MNEPRMRVYRALLHCYPKSFRREYEAQMLQAFCDRCRYDGTSTWPILAREITDAAIAAPTLRWENPMTRVALVAAAISVTLLAAIAGGPTVLVPAIAMLLIVALIAGGRSRLRRPIDNTSRWTRWAGLGAVALMPAAVILATSDEELSEVPWTLMALSIVAGLTLFVTGLIVALSQRPRHTNS